MNSALAILLPRASAKTIMDVDAVIQTTIFCGIGLLMSLSVLILDQYMPGEWF